MIQVRGTNAVPGVLQIVPGLMWFKEPKGAEGYKGINCLGYMNLRPVC